MSKEGRLMAASELIALLGHFPPDAKISIHRGVDLGLYANDVPLATQTGLDAHGFGLFLHGHWMRYRLALCMNHGQIEVVAVKPNEGGHPGFLRWISPDWEEVSYAD